MSNNKIDYKKCEKQFYLHNRFNLVIALLLQAIVASTYIALAFFIMLIVGAMEKTDKAMFTRAMLFLVAVIFVYLIASTLLKVFKNVYIKKALMQFKNYIFEKILRKSLGEFNHDCSGKFISALTNDLNSIELHYLSGTIQIFHHVFMFFITLSAMAYINLTIMLCVLIGCIIPVVVSCILGKKLITKEKQTSDENASFVSQMKDLLNGYWVIKSFQAEKEVLKLFSEQNVTLEETKRDRRETNDAMTIAGEISSLVVVIIIFILGIYFTFEGTMTVASVLGCIQLSNYIIEPIKNLVSLCSNLQAAKSLIQKIADILEEKNSVSVGTLKIEGFEDKIQLENVSLSYEDGKKVLNNVSLTFEKGKSYAIVGESGSGKSTLLKLLLGYFNQYEGSVKIDAHELAEISLESLYDVVSVVQQNVFLFDRSIEENITLFKDFSKEEMRQAIEVAGLSKLVKEKGEDYKCGEGGGNLSGGEKQRISIARCLIRHTPVLLMDEATSALDSETAHQVEKQILELEGVTRIVVTHRMDEENLRKYDGVVRM